VDWKQFQCTFELEKRIVEYEGKKNNVCTNMPKHLHDTYANLNVTEVLSVFFLNLEKQRFSVELEKELVKFAAGVYIYQKNRR
jgi:hypothetical protein